MAKPITQTTPLFGRDAEAFLKDAEDAEKTPISPEEEAKIKRKLDDAFSRFKGMKIHFGS
ncbi:MAG TPA: hypothetical protein VJ385_15390 [Fibrobacteria bacterium]|nr:hypothetical protein [Fibrobacteria bacterium]